MTDHILKNGYTFLAITGGSYGGWAKARDPITAIKDAASNSGSQATKNGVAVMVIYGPSETLECGAMGGFSYEATPEERPTPIGLFFCKGRTIKPMKKGDMNPDHPDHKEWMDETERDIEEEVAFWVKKNETNAA
jgi:hypothetical protein